MSVDAPMLSADEDKLCAGCNKSVNSETGGVVVAFGSSLWHVDWCVLCPLYMALLLGKAESDTFLSKLPASNAQNVPIVLT